MKPLKVNINDLPWVSAGGAGRYGSSDRLVSEHVESKLMDTCVTRLEPGQSNCPYHFHHVGEELFIILEGQARVLMTDHKSREVILATLGAGDYVGEMSLIDNESHSATVEAEVECQTLVLGRDAFTRCLEQNSTVAFTMMRGLVQRLRSADRKIGSLALLGVYGRVANMLIESANPIGDNKKIIRKKISRQDIAKMVGASREMVSRVMKDLEERGIIETQEDGSLKIQNRKS